MKHNLIVVFAAVLFICVSVMAFQYRVAHYQAEQRYEQAIRLHHENHGETVERYNRKVASYEQAYDEVVQERDRLLAILESEGWTQGYTVTGYSANDPAQGTDNIVSTGFNLDLKRVEGLRVAASNYFPTYSIIELWVEGWGLDTRVILDTGLGYLDDDGQWCDYKWVDLLFDSAQEANGFGIREDAWVRVLSWGGE